MIAPMNRIFDLVPCIAPLREIGEIEYGFRNLDLAQTDAGGRQGPRVERAIKPSLFAVASSDQPGAMVRRRRDSLGELRVPSLNCARVGGHLGKRPSVPLGHYVRLG